MYLGLKLFRMTKDINELSEPFGTEMNLTIPDFCLVILIGASSSGKSTFAKRHFKQTQIVSSDRCRAWISDDENDQSVSDGAFELMRQLVDLRLRARRLTVVDATNLLPSHREPFLKIARSNNAFVYAIVLDPGADTCLTRYQQRDDRNFPEKVLAEQLRQLSAGMSRLDGEGFREVFRLESQREIEQVILTTIPMRSDKRSQFGPFDIIGDVHGCADELLELLQTLGYQVELTGKGENRKAITIPPEGRRALFVGDLVDRGPNSPDVLRIVMDMINAGHAMTVPGNHDIKLLRWFNGRNVKLTHGLDLTIEQLGRESKSFNKRVHDFLDGLVSHLWLEGGRLAIAHAGIKTHMLGRSSRSVRVFCFYGETSGETDEFGLPIRYNWAAEYEGDTTVIYGHTPIPEPEWLNNTLCIDTGCVFGGKLTALRWPERELVSVPARKMYVKPIRPMAHPPPRPGIKLNRPDRNDDD